MIPKDNGMNPDSRDALIFDYLEGNLPGEQVKELEDTLAIDHNLRAQLDLWNETFITGEFYPTVQLERSLLKPDVTTVGPSPAYMIVICLISMFFSILPLPLEKPGTLRLQAPKHKETVPTAVQETAGKRVEKIPISKPVAVRSTPSGFVKKLVSTALHTENSVKKPLVFKQLMKLNLLSIRPSNTVLEVKIEENISRKEVKPKSVAKRTITHKEQRAIERMKERALQRRMAIEFLKGRTPYVVPLNTKNF